MIWILATWLVYDSFCTDLINECVDGTDRKIFDNTSWPSSTCGDLMSNSSFVGENFGGELQKELEACHPRSYYLLDSYNSAETLNNIKDLDSPSNSPSNKLLKDMSGKLAFDNYNQSFQDWENMKAWGRGMWSQFWDLAKFQMDNTEVSRENYVFWNKRNS